MPTVDESIGAIQQAAADSARLMAAVQTASATTMSASATTSAITATNSAASDAAKTFGNDVRHAARPS